MPSKSIAPRWYIATYSGEIDVTFYNTRREYDRACRAAEREHEACGIGEGESSWTYGAVNYTPPAKLAKIQRNALADIAIRNSIGG